MVDVYFRFGLEHELTQDPQTHQDAVKYRKIELAAVRNSDVVGAPLRQTKKQLQRRSWETIGDSNHSWLHSRGKSFGLVMTCCPSVTSAIDQIDAVTTLLKTYFH